MRLPVAADVMAARGVRVFRWVILALALALVLLGTGQNSVGAQAPSQDYVAGEILVKFEPSASAEAADDAHTQNDGQAQETIPGIDVQVVEVDPGQEQAAVAAYEQDPNVVFAEVNGTYEADNHGIPDDLRVNEQWQYHNTGQTGGTRDADIYAFEAWHTTTGSSTVPIAVLDSGIDQTHEDLQGKVTKNINFSTSSSTVDDLYGHGTHVAGIAAAGSDNETGVAGTCGGCEIYNVKVLDSNGDGYWSEIANGIRWAADNGAKVINLSLGGSTPSSTVEEAVDYAWGEGVVVVASAGNSGVSNPNYPAYFANVMAVGATDHNDAKAGFSNHGSSWVDVAAPGDDVLSTAPDHDSQIFGSGVKYGKMSGTSMASPHVAGVAGLVLSASPNATNQEVRDKIETTADDISGTGTYWTYGRINACRAVGGTSCSRASTPSDTTPPTTTAPDKNLFVPAQLGSASVPVKLNWSGSDTGSGVDRYELEKSTDGGAYSAVALPAPSATGVTASLDPGHAYRFRVRAQDKAGNLSGWREGPGFALKARQENDSNISYSTGDWVKDTPGGAYGGAVKFAKDSGSKVRFTFTGNQVAWVSTKSSKHGRAEVYVDGVYERTVDLFSSTKQERQVVFSERLASSGEHTVMIKPTGTKNRSSSGTRVDIDAFVSAE